jgi:hypothetical protein
MRITIYSLSFILLSISLVTSCNGKDESSECEGLCQRIKSEDEAYLKIIDQVRAQRNSPPRMVPIDEKVGWVYLEAFKNDVIARKSDQTLFVKLSKANLAFLYRQLERQGIDTLGVGFAKYDTTGFAAQGLEDPIYVQRAAKMKDRYSVIMGGWEKGGKGRFIPFMDNRDPSKVYNFFDDWHNEDP